MASTFIDNNETDFSTFPRAKGISESYVVTFSDKGAGIMYVHSENKESGNTIIE